MTARDTFAELAGRHGWTIADAGLSQRATRGAEVIDVRFNRAGAIEYGALFLHGEDPRQLDHVDRRTQARRARVLSWIAYAEVRAAQRAAAE